MAISPRARNWLIAGGLCLAVAGYAGKRALDNVLVNNITAQFSIPGNGITGPTEYARSFQKGSVLYTVIRAQPQGRVLGCTAGLPPDVSIPATGPAGEYRFNIIMEEFTGGPKMKYDRSDTANFRRLRRECDRIEQVIDSVVASQQNR